MCNAKQTVANRHSQLFFMEVVILEVALECMFSTTHNLTANHDKIVLCYLFYSLIPSTCLLLQVELKTMVHMG